MLIAIDLMFLILMNISLPFAAMTSFIDIQFPCVTVVVDWLVPDGCIDRKHIIRVIAFKADLF